MAHPRHASGRFLAFLTCVGFASCAVEDSAPSESAAVVDTVVPTRVYLTVLDEIISRGPAVDPEQVVVASEYPTVDYRNCGDIPCWELPPDTVRLPSAVRDSMVQRGYATEIRQMCPGMLTVAFSHARQLPSTHYIVETQVFDLRREEWEIFDTEVHILDCPEGYHCTVTGGSPGFTNEWTVDTYDCPGDAE